MEAQTFNLEVVKNIMVQTFKGKKAVMIKSDSYAVEVHHYNACIVTVLPDGTVKIDNGGYETRTTKRHINNALQGLGIKLGITQKKFNWYLTDGREFERKMTITK